MAIAGWQLSKVAGVVGGSWCRWLLSGCQLSRWQFAQVAVVLGGSCPGGSVPTCQLSWWQLSLVADFRVAIVLEPIITYFFTLCMF